MLKAMGPVSQNHKKNTNVADKDRSICILLQRATFFTL